MKHILTYFLIVFTISSASAARLYPESAYQKQWCEAHNGQLEYRLNDKTRVDCLTKDLAVEFDFANKWAECAGQAQYYGLKTGRQATCVLIMEHGEKDLKYLKRLRKVAYKKGIKTFTMKPEKLNIPINYIK